MKYCLGSVVICKCCLWTWAPCHHGKENYFQVYPHIVPDNITEALCQPTLSRSWVMQQNNDPKTQVNWLQCIFMEKKKFKTWSFSVTLDKSQDLLWRPEYRNAWRGKKLMSQYIMMIPDCVKFWLKFEDIFKDIWWYAVWRALVIFFFVPADSGFSAALHKLSLTLGQPFIWFFSMLCLKSPGCRHFFTTVIQCSLNFLR